MNYEQENMIQSHGILKTSDIKKDIKQVYLEHAGKIHHYTSQNLHPITKLLIDYFFDALPKMHDSFIQPMK